MTITATVTTVTTCDTCSHIAQAHPDDRCDQCSCRLYIDPASVRAELRAAARREGWRLGEQEFLDDFRRDGDYVTVIYAPATPHVASETLTAGPTAFERVLGVNTPACYVVGSIGLLAALAALQAPL